MSGWAAGVPGQPRHTPTHSPRAGAPPAGPLRAPGTPLLPRGRDWLLPCVHTGLWGCFLCGEPWGQSPRRLGFFGLSFCPQPDAVCQGLFLLPEPSIVLLPAGHSRWPEPVARAPGHWGCWCRITVTQAFTRHLSARAVGKPRPLRRAPLGATGPATRQSHEGERGEWGRLSLSADADPSPVLQCIGATAVRWR